jgi:hypothetical protein
LIENEIATHAIDAFDPDQIKAILRPKTKKVERLDEQNKPTGEYMAQVDWVTVDKEGKEVRLKLSVKDTIKSMKENPAKYGNLWKTKAQGGLGDNTDPSMPPTNIDIENMSPEEYLKNREKVLANQGK